MTILLIDWSAVLFVLLASAIADCVGPTVLYGFFGDDAASGQPCNKLLAARFLFWGLLASELVAAGKLVFFPLTREDINDYCVRADAAVASNEKWRLDRWVPQKMAVLALIILFLGYWGSYHMAYRYLGLCEPSPWRAEILDYWYMWGAFGCRSIAPMVGLDRWCAIIAARSHR